MNNYEVCQVPTYKINYDNTKKTNKPVESIIPLLNNDLGLHERLYKNDLLKLFIDLDNKEDEKEPNKIMTPIILTNVLNDICDYVGVNLEDISYTTNFSVKYGSYHIVITSKHMSSKHQKQFWTTFKQKYNHNYIDTIVYDRDGWFRLPNQSKEKNTETKHIIQKGNPEDFILKYIEKSTLFVPAKNEEDKTDDESVLSEITLDNDDETIKTKNKGGSAETLVPVLTNEEENYNDIDYLLNVCIKNKMCDSGNHVEWNIIGQALKNELGNDATEPFLKWTLKYGSTNKKNEAFNQITKYIKKAPLKQKDRLTLKTIYYYAKKYNPEAYNLRFNMIDNTTDHYKDYQIFANNGDYGLANYFCKHWGHLFKCVDIKNKRFYGFNKKCLWEEFNAGHQIREVISNEMYNNLIETKKIFYKEKEKNKDDEISNEELSKITKQIEETLVKLMKTNDKNNITREIQDKIFDDTFEDTLNKQKYILPIKNNKIFNMKTLEVTDRNINDLFSYECNANFVSMNALQEEEIRKYFLDLFCGKEDMMKVVLNIFKSILSGETLRYIYFFTGSGSNGKSLLFSILNNIFNKSMDTIDTRVILESKSSNLTTEFEKLDKCRIGYVTELKEKDVLNTTLIKKVSGGDAIDYRGLYQSNKTIKPTCNLCVLTNKMPIFEVEKAIMNRIIVIPFNNTFETNNTFESEMLEKRDLIFSFIMKYGVIQDKFEETEEMIIAKEDYKNDNIKIDYLEDFIEKHFELIPFVKEEKIKRDDFRTQYNEFLKSKGQSQDNSSNQKFTRLIRTKNIGIKESNGKTYYTGLIYKTENELDDENDE
jgi:P4 family phage/plasmid primase-like protien